MIYLSLLLSLIIFAGCQQKSVVRHYTQIVVEPASTVPSTANSRLKGRLTWEAPADWEQSVGQGMRLATFHLKGNPEALDVSIVALAGKAGGVDANVKRWLRQLHLQTSGSQQQAFLQSSSNHIFDFTRLQKGQVPSTQSMITAVLDINNATVFVKMTGSIQAVTQHKKEFVRLVDSIHFQ